MNINQNRMGFPTAGTGSYLKRRRTRKKVASKESLCPNLLVKLNNKVQYFGDESNLHGIGNVFSLSYIPFFKRIFWLAILVCCGLGAAAILRSALALYSGDVVSYSVETNYLAWDTPFPAVTVCDQLDSDRIKTHLKKNNLPTSLNNFFKDVSVWTLKYCRVCADCSPNTTCVEEYAEHVNKIRRNCSEFLTDCWWAGQKFSCCERFLPLVTEYGVCFAFNSQLTGSNNSILMVNRKVGLPSLVITTTQAIMIRVSSPDDEISASMDNVLGRVNSVLPLVTEFEAILKAEQTISDVSVRSLTPTQRGCLFAHERPPFAEDWPFSDYTYSTCLMYCRVTAQVQLCNCTHFFLQPLKDVPVCNIAGMGCLAKNSNSLLNVSCDCPMQCDDILYKTVHVFNNRYSGKVPPELARRGTRAKIHLVQLPALRVRRHAIRDTLGLVVDIGGVGGVFFGASLLSLLEILYIFCIRRGPNEETR